MKAVWWWHRVMAVFGMVVALILVVSVAYITAFRGKILPGVRIVGVEVGNLTGEEAAGLIEKKVDKEWGSIKVIYGEEQVEIKPEDMGVEVDMPATINEAWLVGRKGNWLERLGQAHSSYSKGKELTLSLKVDEEKAKKVTVKLADRWGQEEVPPAVSLKKQGKERQIEVELGKNGLVMDEELLKQHLLAKWSRLQSTEEQAPITLMEVEVDEETAKKVKMEAAKLLNKELVMKQDDESWSFGGEELVGLLMVAEPAVFDAERVKMLVAEFAKSVNRRPQNATFKFEGGRVQEFRPGKDGLQVVEEDMVKRILESYFTLLEKDRVELRVAVIRTPPKIKTSDVNDLGIKELLGKGESTYFHSIPNRVYNVGLAAGRLAGVLVPPGEEFSFNENLGEVSGATGYKAAYIISEGRTILGDGGGVCQVSTTLFRAALAAGLPITERKAHAYRVGYYEQDSPAGIDATVYAGSADLKFRNDTPEHILIQPVIDLKNFSLSFEIYGSSDGRKVTLTKPKLWGQTPPPPTLYQDDPTLPVGTLKQVDWSAWGAKTSFDYTVAKNGETIFEKTFVSTYRPWQAIYLRGTATQ